MKWSISKLLLLGGVASASAVLLALVVVWVLSASMVEERNDRQRELLMGAIANQVNTTFQSHADTIEALVREPRVVNAFKGNDKRIRVELEKQLMSVFPKAWDVRLIDPGMDELDTLSSPQLGYADLAMIRESERDTEPPLAGAHAIGSDQAHISMIHKVIGEDGKQVTGHLMVLFNMELMTGFLHNLNLTNGYAQIRQKKMDGNDLVLADVGEPVLSGGADPLVFPIEGSRWQLAYWTDPAVSGLPSGFLIGLLIVAFTLFVVIGLIFFFINRLVSSNLQKDLGILITMTRDFLAGNLKQRYQAALPDAAGSIKIIQELLGKVSTNKKKPPAKIDPANVDEHSATPDLDLDL